MTDPAPARPGTVYLAGWGPGDGELATRRALQLARAADLLIAEPTIAVACRGGEAPPAAVLDPASDGWRQEAAQAAAAGQVVVVLLRGDALADHAGREMLEHFAAAGIPVEPVPGVPLAALTEPAVAAARARRPLHGRRILITRPREQAGEMAAWLREAGAEPVLHPTIAIEPVSDTGPMDRAMDRLAQHDWVIFTSANGVHWFLHHLARRGRDLRAFGGARVAAIGPATADRLAAAGLQVDLVPERFVAEGLLDALAADLAGQRILIPRAREARDILPDTLRRRGATVEVLVTYQAVPVADGIQAVRADLANGRLHAVTFTSSSTVSRFVEQFAAGEAAELLARHATVVACIGPITARTAIDLGLPVQVEAASFTVPDLVAALSRHFTGA